MYAQLQGDDEVQLDFDTYAIKYNRLAYESFPFSFLFSWNEKEDDSVLPLNNREDCRKLALWRASKKFQKIFDLNRSYRENKGDTEKLEDDILKMFWHFYREEYPNEHSMNSQPQKFKNSCRSNIENIRASISRKKQEEERLNRLRGATKRYEKEVDYRNKIGDKEFNRRMKEEKVEKHKKGSNNDEKYLAFILWRKEQLKTPNSIYFNCSVESRNVINKLYNFGYRFTRDSVEQLDFALQWPVRHNWSALARWNYSTRDKQLIEGVFGFERDSGCWKSRFVAHRFASAIDEYSTSFFFQLELVGLSKLGLNPLDVLKQNIRGYGKK